MKSAKLDLAKAAAPGCCTQKSLAEFSERARAINSCPETNWIYAGHTSWIAAYKSMIELGEFCSCKLIVLGVRINNSRIWSEILQSGSFTLPQRRAIGEAGTWEVLKLGSIFQEPFQRSEVLAYAEKVNSLSVWVEALKTKTLIRRDVRKLVRRKNADDHRFLAKHIIGTGLLNEREVYGYLGKLKHWQTDAALVYAELRGFRGQKLMGFSLFVEKLVNWAHMDSFWSEALKNGKHGLSRIHLLELVAKDEAKRRGCQDQYSEKLLVAVIRTGLLRKSDLALIRQCYRSSYVQSALLDAAIAA